MKTVIYIFQLADTGKSMIKQEVERYVPVTKLKYYFAVDTKYVLSKLFLLFFPFTHKVRAYYLFLFFAFNTRY